MMRLVMEAVERSISGPLAQRLEPLFSQANYYQYETNSVCSRFTGHRPARSHAVSEQQETGSDS